MNTKFFTPLVVCIFMLIISLSADAQAADAQEILQSRIDAMERELTELRAILEQQSRQTVSSEELQEIKVELQSVHANQAEFKTYDSKVHLAGYAAIGYTDNGVENDSFDQVSFNPIFHYNYKDLLLLEAELEMELEGEDVHIGMEYLTVDWFINDYVVLEAGKFLSPVGQFRQNLHPAWINKLPSAPVGFGHEGAAPLSDVGLQLRGGFPVNLINDSSLINYAVYVGNGPVLEVEEEDGEFEIHAVEAEGFTGDEDGEKTFGGRLGFVPIPNLEIAVSGTFGDISLEDESTRDYEVLGFDLFYNWKNLDLRAEYVRQEVGELASSIAPEGQEWEAWYAQASYKVLPTKIELVTRYGELNSSHASQEQEQWSIGINYLLANQGMAKLAYEFNDGVTGSERDEDRFLIQLTYGF